MKALKIKIMSGFVLLFTISICHAIDQKNTYPEAPNRSNIQNYKDMVLGYCLAEAYREDKIAPVDAGSSANELVEWTDFDLEQNTEKMIILINKYLSRNYFNPIVDFEIKGLKFDFFKCLDLYHSKDLDKLASKVIKHPFENHKTSFKHHYQKINRHK